MINLTWLKFKINDLLLFYRHCNSGDDIQCYSSAEYRIMTHLFLSVFLFQIFRFVTMAR